MPVAIVGMAGRFPGAANIAALWTLVVGGESGLTLFSDEELRAHGVTPDTLKQANYIKTKGIVDDHEWFDADFFGYTPNEAECMDPANSLIASVLLANSGTRWVRSCHLYWCDWHLCRTADIPPLA